MQNLECVYFYSERGAPTVGALGNDAHGHPLLGEATTLWIKIGVQ